MKKLFYLLHVVALSIGGINAQCIEEAFPVFTEEDVDRLNCSGSSIDLSSYSSERGVRWSGLGVVYDQGTGTYSLNPEMVSEDYTYLTYVYAPEGCDDTLSVSEYVTTVNVIDSIPLQRNLIVNSLYFDWNSPSASIDSIEWHGNSPQPEAVNQGVTGRNTYHPESEGYKIAMIYYKDSYSGHSVSCSHLSTLVDFEFCDSTLGYYNHNLITEYCPTDDLVQLKTPNTPRVSYSGNGVITDGDYQYFNPSIGAGIHGLIYSESNECGAEYYDEVIITVYDTSARLYQDGEYLIVGSKNEIEQITWYIEGYDPEVTTDTIIQLGDNLISASAEVVYSSGCTATLGPIDLNGTCDGVFELFPITDALEPFICNDYIIELTSGILDGRYEGEGVSEINTGQFVLDLTYYQENEKESVELMYIYDDGCGNEIIERDTFYFLEAVAELEQTNDVVSLVSLSSEFSIQDYGNYWYSQTTGSVAEDTMHYVLTETELLSVTVIDVSGRCSTQEYPLGGLFELPECEPETQSFPDIWYFEPFVCSNDEFPLNNFSDNGVFSGESVSQTPNGTFFSTDVMTANEVFSTTVNYTYSDGCGDSVVLAKDVYMLEGVVSKRVKDDSIIVDILPPFDTLEFTFEWYLGDSLVETNIYKSFPAHEPGNYSVFVVYWPRECGVTLDFGYLDVFGCIVETEFPVEIPDTVCLNHGAVLLEPSSSEVGGYEFWGDGVIYRNAEAYFEPSTLNAPYTAHLYYGFYDACQTWTEFEKDVYVASCVINNLSLGGESEFVVYPNPTSGTVNIIGNFDLAQVYDVQGLKLTESVDSSVDLSGLDSGVYYLKVISSSGEVSVTEITKQ